MSELAKEKLYRKELIKAGATGDNNVARIRSLANGGGGGSQKYIVEKVKEDNSYRRSKITTLMANNLICSFGGAKYSPTYNLTSDTVIYSLESKDFTTRTSTMGVATSDPVVLEFGGMFLFFVNGGNQLIVNAVSIDAIMGNGFEDFYFLDNIENTNEFLNGFITGYATYLLDSNYDFYNLTISANVTNKEIAFSNFGIIYSTGDKPSTSLVYADSWKIGTKIYVLFEHGELYSFNTNGFVWVFEGNIQNNYQYVLSKRNGCLIGNDYYFINLDTDNLGIYKLDSLSLKVTKLEIDENYLYPSDSQLFNFNGEIGIAGGTGSNVHFTISKLTPKQ